MRQRVRPHLLAVAAVLAAALAAAWTFAAESAPLPKPAEILVFPPDVELTTARDRQSLIVQARYPDGITRDVTTEAKFVLADSKLARFDNHTLYPVGDGKTQLDVTYAGLNVKLPVTIKNATLDPPISF